MYHWFMTMLVYINVDDIIDDVVGSNTMLTFWTAITCPMLSWIVELTLKILGIFLALLVRYSISGLTSGEKCAATSKWQFELF